MSGSGGALSVPAEHLPGLVALIAMALIAGAAPSALRALAVRDVRWATVAMARWDRLSFAARAAFWGVLVGAVAHAALVPTHWGEERTIALLFIANVIGFAIAAVWILGARRHWAGVALTALGGTTAIYAWYLLTGREDADLVGLLTTTVELAAALVVLRALMTRTATGATDRRPRWLVTSLGAILVAVLGMGTLAAASSSTSSADADTAANASPSMSMGDMAGMAGMGGTTSASRALSLATTSPAGPITWPDDMSAMAAGMTMATPNCTAQPTDDQQQAAVTLVDQTVVAATPYQSLAAARAAGYVPLTPTGKRIVHYINPAIYRQGASLDPTKIPVLVYVNTSRGAVLSAAMYLMPFTAVSPPQPGGCLTQWHIHTDLCLNGSGVVGTDEAGGCGAGSSNRPTPPMMHVWLTPISGGPLAPDPAARNQVAAADQVTPTAAPNGTA